MVKTSHEITLMRQGGRILSRTLASVVSQARPGISLKELDMYAQECLVSAGGEAAFRGYQGTKGERPYPATLCASVNDEVVHGAGTRDIFLQEGDIVGFDLGVRYPKKTGLYTDMAVTVGVGNISAKAQQLIEVTRNALMHAIELVWPGQELRTISRDIQRIAEKRGYGVIRDLTGHGIGYELHEEPSILNYDDASAPRFILKQGMTICIEPMISAGTWRVTLAPDGWTIRTADGELAAHFEHTVLVTEQGAEILTRFNG